MILIDDIKYACMECVRGHRSSLCKHHQRPLLQVRSKGRPVVYANGNPNHRVAVFAEEIADSGNKESKKCKTEPIIILKTSMKQVVDLKSGEIIGPYDESKTQKSKMVKVSPPPPIINHDSFINNSSCCTPKISKGKSCGCCNNKKKAVNKSRILQTYIKKKLNHQIKQENNVVLMNDTETDDKKQVFGVVPVPSCSIPGTCCCDDTCACAGCMVHGNSKVDQKLPTEFIDYNSTSFPKDESIVFNSLPTSYSNYMNGNSSIQEQTEASTESSPNECSCPPDACDCTNCETHGILNGYRLDDYFKDQTKIISALDFNFEDLIAANNQPLQQQQQQPSLIQPPQLPQLQPQHISLPTQLPSQNGMIQPTANFEVFDYNFQNHASAVMNNESEIKPTKSCCSKKL
ncbi:MAC1 Metal-binding activator 1 [Candida maltosa Xu316]